MNKIHLKFVLRTDRTNAEGTYSLYLYANINSEVKYFTLNRLIPKNAWNEKRQEVRSSYPDRNLINDDIVSFAVLKTFRSKLKILKRRFHSNFQTLQTF